LLPVSFLSCHMKFGFHANCTKKEKCPTTDCTWHSEMFFLQLLR
jgi:hypothetical protein